MDVMVIHPMAGYCYHIQTYNFYVHGMCYGFYKLIDDYCSHKTYSTFSSFRK